MHRPNWLFRVLAKIAAPIAFGLTGMATLLVSSNVGAQADWPSRPLTMIIPFPPGGVADTVGRPVAEALGRALNQSVVVENKGGAGTPIQYLDQPQFSQFVAEEARQMDGVVCAIGKVD